MTENLPPLPELQAFAHTLRTKAAEFAGDAGRAMPDQEDYTRALPHAQLAAVRCSEDQQQQQHEENYSSGLDVLRALAGAVLIGTMFWGVLAVAVWSLIHFL